jgi:hypothetical protein
MNQPLKGVLSRPLLSDRDADFAIDLIEKIIETNYSNRAELKNQIEATLKSATDSLFDYSRFTYDQARAVMIAICPRLAVDIDFFLYEFRKADNKKGFINYLENKIPGFKYGDSSVDISNQVIDTLLINFLVEELS